MTPTTRPGDESPQDIISRATETQLAKFAAKFPNAVLEERIVARELVDEFARRFQANHGMSIRFTDAAAELLVKEALEKSQSVRELCAMRFKDFHFGLKLIAQNSGQREFVIDKDAVDAPDKTLSDWVVASYRQSGGQPAAGGA